MLTISAEYDKLIIRSLLSNAGTLLTYQLFGKTLAHFNKNCPYQEKASVDQGF